MSPGSPVGGLHVAFSSIGEKELLDALKGIKDALIGSGGTKDAADKSAGSFAMMSMAFASSVRAVTSHLESFVRQGVGASVAGEVMSIQFAELANQIASLFVPEIQVVIDKLQQVVNWFRSLTGEQQRNLAFWGKLALGATAVAVILPQIITAFNALRVTWLFLNAAFVASPMGLVIVAIALAVHALVEAFGGWEKAMHSLKELFIDFGESFKDAMKIAADSVGVVVKKLREAIEGFDEFMDKKMGMEGKRQEDDPSWFKESAGAGFKMARTFSPVGLFTGEFWGFSDLKKDLQERANRLDPARRELERARLLHERTGTSGTGTRTDLAPRSGGFESLNATYQRIAKASMLATAGISIKDAPERSADALEWIKNWIDGNGGKAINDAPAAREAR